MKIYILITSAVFIALCFSCNDDDSEKIFPDKYVKILSLKESGIIDLSMNTTQQNVLDSILILKGGGRPNSASSVELIVLAKEEAAFLGGYEIDEIELLPSDCYEIMMNGKIQLESYENYKYVPVTFFPQKIYAAMKKYEDDVVWALPIALYSITDTINTSQNKLLIRIDVRSPIVNWNIDDSKAEITYRSLNWSISTKIANSEENNLDFTCELDATENEKLVTDYNNKHQTNYEILPSSSYQFEKFTFKKGEMVSNSKLTLTREGLQSDYTYLLPMKMGVISTNAIEITDDIKYLVITNPKYGYEQVDRDGWKFILCNCQEGWKAPNFHVTSLIDNNFDTSWATNWSKELALSDDYDYMSVEEWGYHSFLLRRDIPNIIIVIDLGRQTTLGGIGICQGSANIGDRDLKSSEFYLADTFTFSADGDLNNYNNVNKGNTWNLAITCSNIPNVGGGPYWYHISDSESSPNIVKGRYLKIKPIESHRGIHLVSFSELYIKELVTIDGYPIE